MEDQIKCPKCGSTQVTANKKGFSGRKAIAGAVLTGGIGLLAGTLGSNKIKITCLSCGKQFGPGEGRAISSPSIKKPTETPIVPYTAPQGPIGKLGIGMLIFILVIIILMFRACLPSNAPPTATTTIPEISSQTTDATTSSSLKFDRLYPGQWILSINYPDENDFKKLYNIYVSNNIFGTSGDYIHAKKSKDFESDHKFILCNTDGTTWKYYIVNVFSRKVKKIHPGPNEITPPDISALQIGK